MLSCGLICSIAAIANSFMKQKIYSGALPDIKSDLLKRYLSQNFATHNGRWGARVVGGGVGGREGQRGGEGGGRERETNDQMMDKNGDIAINISVSSKMKECCE